MPSILELRQERAKVIADARKLVTDADNEKRGLKPEEKEVWDKHIKKAEELKDDIDRREQLERFERESTDPANPITTREKPGTTGENTEEQLEKLHLQEFRSFLKGRRSHLSRQERRALEKRGMVADTDAKGGTMIAPKLFKDRLIKDLDNLVFVREFAEKFDAGDANTIGVPSLDADPDDATWTTEIATVTEDDSTRVGKREMTPHRLVKLVKASDKFLARAGAEMGENFVRGRLAYKYAVTEENAYLNGHGSGRPLGMFVASAKGISIARDTAGNNTTTALDARTFVTAKYLLKSGYLTDPSLRWIFHRTVVSNIMLLRDGEERFIWQPGLTVGQPEMLLGIPVAMSEYAPYTQTAGLYVGLLGALRYYGIAEAEALMIKRLDELYTETSQTGFKGERYVDGMPLLESAFVRIKMADA